MEGSDKAETILNSTVGIQSLVLIFIPSEFRWMDAYDSVLTWAEHNVSNIQLENCSLIFTLDSYHFHFFQNHSRIYTHTCISLRSEKGMIGLTYIFVHLHRSILWLVRKRFIYLNAFAQDVELKDIFSWVCVVGEKWLLVRANHQEPGS